MSDSRQTASVYLAILFFIAWPLTAQEAGDIYAEGDPTP